MSPPRRESSFAVLQDRNLAIFVVSRFFSGAAMTLLRASIAWHLYELTRSAFHLGLVGLVQFVPAVPTTLLGGAVADSYDRKRIVLWAQLGLTLISAALLGVARSQGVSIVAVYALIALLAVVRGFENPARAALLPSLVSRERFPAAVTVVSTFQQLAWVSGPVAMGFAVDWGGAQAAYALHLALVVAAGLSLALVRVPERSGERRGVSMAAVREGVAFVVRSQPVLGAMTLDMFAVIFAGATALLPIYASDILHVGARGYGLLSASLELGTAAMAILLAFRRPIEEPGRALLASVAVFGLATIGFGFSRWFVPSVLAFAVAGMADQISMVCRQTIIQLSTPDELRGRVSAVNFLFIGASNQLGSAESGFLAALTTATFSVVFGGVACLGVVAAVAAGMPALGRYRASPSEATGG